VAKRGRSSGISNDLSELGMRRDCQKLLAGLWSEDYQYARVLGSNDSLCSKQWMHKSMSHVD
jgi:hypothetical protein